MSNGDSNEHPRHVLVSQSAGKISLLSWTELKSNVVHVCDGQRLAFDGPIKIGEERLEFRNGRISCTGKLHCTSLVVDGIEFDKALAEQLDAMDNELKTLEAEITNLENSLVDKGGVVEVESTNITDGPACLTTDKSDLHMGDSDYGFWWKKGNANDAQRCVRFKVKTERPSLPDFAKMFSGVKIDVSKIRLGFGRF